MAVKGHVVGRPIAHVTKMVFLALHYANAQTGNIPDYRIVLDDDL